MGNEPRYARQNDRDCDYSIVTSFSRLEVTSKMQNSITGSQDSRKKRVSFELYSFIMDICLRVKTPSHSSVFVVIVEKSP